MHVETLGRTAGQHQKLPYHQPEPFSDPKERDVSFNDLISFIAEIIQSYKSIAQKRGIALRLITNERQLNTWIDVAMLDKVIFHFLSNAFKFTNDNGFIHVYVSKEGDEATVSEIAYKVGFSSPSYFPPSLNQNSV